MGFRTSSFSQNPSAPSNRMRRQINGLADWSRRIDQKHRLIYRATEDAILIASADFTIDAQAVPYFRSSAFSQPEIRSRCGSLPLS